MSGVRDLFQVLHGNTITLDAPVPSLDGQRVSVIITRPTRTWSSPLRKTRLRDEWIKRGPQAIEP
jgi:hypothetical protein